MGKGLLFLAIGICLVVHVQPLSLLSSILNPVEGIVDNVVNLVGGVVEVVISLPTSLVGGKCGGGGGGTGDLLSKALTGLVDSLGDTVEGVLETVDGVLQAVIALVVSLIEALLGTIRSLLFGLTSCFDSVVSQPLITVKRLEATAIYKVNRARISTDLIIAFQPLQDILDGVVKQLSGIVAAVPCILETLLVNFTTEAIKGIGEVLECALPLLGEVTSATKLVGETVIGAVNIVGKTLGGVLECSTKKSSLLDIGQILSCLTGSLANSLQGVDGLLDRVLPIVQNVLRKVLQLAECELKVFAKGFKTLAAILQRLGQCVASKGVTVKVPFIPMLSIPNFIAIAEKACITIEVHTSSALAAKSPISELKLAIEKLIKAMEYICPAEIEILVKKITNKTQDSINSINEIVKNNRNPEVKACVSKAQTDLDKLGPKSEKEIVSCSAALGPDAATVISEAAELEVELKKEVINAAADAYDKCNKLVYQSDKNIQNCFDKALSETQNRIIEINKKINLATAKANALVDKDYKCLWGGLDDLEQKAGAIVKELKDCLAKQNVVIPSTDVTVIVQVCTKNLRLFILELRPILTLLRALIKTIEGLLAFILRLVADILCKIIGPLLEAVGSILKSLLGVLGRNDRVSYCTTGNQDRLTKIGVESNKRADECVKTKKILASEYVLRAVTEERTITTVVANAEVDAQVKCQGSVNIFNCYSNFKSNLDVTVKQSKEKIQYYAATVKLLVAESLSCVYTEETSTAVIADRELESVKVCLSKENINILFKS